MTETISTASNGLKCNNAGEATFARQQRHEPFRQIERVSDSDETAGTTAGSPREDLVEHVLMRPALQQVVHLVQNDQDALVTFANERRQSLLCDRVRLSLGSVGAECLRTLQR